jgi:uncharacterized protein (UPF0262 family)
VTSPTSKSNRLSGITLDETGLPPPTPEIEQERRVAIFDLLEDNRFALRETEGGKPPAGPYQLDLSVRDRRLVFDISSQSSGAAGGFYLSLAPFNQIIKDYLQICDSYFDAVRRLPPARIEAIDEGRRLIHDEGARGLLENLCGLIETDMATARRLFSLICVLHFKN